MTLQLPQEEEKVFHLNINSEARCVIRIVLLEATWRFYTQISRLYHLRSMRSLGDSISCRKGPWALCNWAQSSASSRFIFRGLQPRRRSPSDFVNPSCNPNGDLPDVRFLCVHLGIAAGGEPNQTYIYKTAGTYHVVVVATDGNGHLHSHADHSGEGRNDHLGTSIISAPANRSHPARLPRALHFANSRTTASLGRRHKDSVRDFAQRWPLND